MESKGNKDNENSSRATLKEPDLIDIISTKLETLMKQD